MKPEKNYSDGESDLVLIKAAKHRQTIGSDIFRIDFYKIRTKLSLPKRQNLERLFSFNNDAEVIDGKIIRTRFQSSYYSLMAERM